MVKCIECKWWDKDNTIRVKTRDSNYVRSVAKCTDNTAGKVLVEGEREHFCPYHETNRIKELTVADIEEKYGCEVKIVKE